MDPTRVTNCPSSGSHVPGNPSVPGHTGWLVTLDPTDSVLRRHDKNCYANKFPNENEVDEFFGRHNLPKWTQKEIEESASSCN